MLPRRIVFQNLGDELIIVNVDSMKVESKRKLVSEERYSNRDLDRDRSDPLSTCKFICRLGYKTLFGFYKYFGSFKSYSLSPTYNIIAIEGTSDDDSKFKFSKITLPLQLTKNDDNSNLDLQFIKGGDNNRILIKSRDDKKMIIDFSSTIPVAINVSDVSNNEDLESFNLSMATFKEVRDTRGETNDGDKHSFSPPATVVEQYVFKSTFFDCYNERQNKYSGCGQRELFLIFNSHSLQSKHLTTLEIVDQKENSNGKLTTTATNVSTFEHISYVRHCIELSFDQIFFGVISDGFYTMFLLTLSFDDNGKEDGKLRTELKNLGRLKELDNYFEDATCGLNLVSQLSSTASEVSWATEMICKFTNLPTDLAKLIVRF